MKQLAGDCHQGLKLGLIPRLQVQVKGFQIRIEAYPDQSGHIQCASKIAVAVSANARWFMHRTARNLVGWIEPTMCDPLACGHLRIEWHKLTEQLQRACSTSAKAALRSLVIRFFSPWIERFES